MSCQSTDAIDNALKLLLTPPNAVNYAAALPKRAPINLSNMSKMQNMDQNMQNMTKKYAEYEPKYSEYAI